MEIHWRSAVVQCCCTRAIPPPPVLVRSSVADADRIVSQKRKRLIPNSRSLPRYRPADSASHPESNAPPNPAAILPSCVRDHTISLEPDSDIRSRLGTSQWMLRKVSTMMSSWTLPVELAAANSAQAIDTAPAPFSTSSMTHRGARNSPLKSNWILSNWLRSSCLFQA